MRFGWTLPNNWGIEDADSLVALGPMVEERGFSSVWVNHHVLNIGYVGDRLGGQPYHDALTVLTWVAAQTSRVRLGTSVLVLPYLHPMVTAKALATLDVLSGGRVVAGVGVGSLQAENDLLAMVPYERRGAYADESLALMRTMWTQDEPAFEGEFFRLSGARFAPKPRQEPLPILVGGNRRPALRRVARFGQGWHPLGASPDGVRRRREALDAELESAGRDPSSVETSLRWDVRADQDVARLVEDYAEAGVGEIVWSLSTPDLDEIRRTIDRLAGDILPRFATA